MPRTREAQDRHNELRRRSRSNARKAVYIAEYVEIKYPNIFKEAEGSFSILDQKYQDKHDLRKTDEFLFLKLKTEGKLACESLPTETAMDSESLSAETATCESLPTETATCESLPTETATCESLPTETATCESLPTETAMDSESLSAETATCESLPTETATCESLPTETAMDSESLSAETATCESLPAEKVSSPVTKHLQLQLEIDLMSEQQVREAAVTTQTLSVTTEQEDPPVSLSDIPVDMIDEIICQLRQDPDLIEIFKDIDLQMEFEQLGEDLDIPQMNLLEDELFW